MDAKNVELSLNEQARTEILIDGIRQLFSLHVNASMECSSEQALFLSAESVKAGLEFTAQGQTEFAGKFMALLALSREHASRSEWLQSIVSIKLIDELWKNADALVRMCAKETLRQQLRMYAIEIFAEFENHASQREAPIVLAQLALRVAHYPGLVQEFSPQSAPRDAHLLTHQKFYLNYLAERAVIVPLLWGEPRLAVVSACTFFEHGLRQRTGIQSISQSLIRQAVLGTETTASVYEGSDPLHRTAVSNLCCGFYGLFRTPAKYKSHQLDYTRAFEQVQVVNLLCHVLAPLSLRSEKALAGAQDAIIPVDYIRKLFPSVAKACEAPWLSNDYRAVVGAAMEVLEQHLRHFAAEDKNSVAACAHELRKNGFKAHRNWRDAVSGLQELVNAELALLTERPHSAYAVTCAVSQLIRVLEATSEAASMQTQTTIDRDHQDEQNESTNHANNLLNYINDLTLPVNQVGLLAPRYACDNQKVYAILKCLNPDEKVPVLDDFFQSLIFFMRDCPMHSRLLDTPDSVFADTRLMCDLIARRLGIYAAEFSIELDAWRKDRKLELLEVSLSLVHPQLARQVHNAVLLGNVIQATQETLAVLWQQKEKFPQDQTPLGQYPRDLHAHYAARLFHGGLAYFESQFSQEAITTATFLQVLFLTNRVLEMTVPRNVDVYEFSRSHSWLSDG